MEFLRFTLGVILFFIVDLNYDANFCHGANLPPGWRKLISNNTFSYSVRHYRRPINVQSRSGNAAVLEGDIRTSIPLKNQHNRHGHQRFFNAIIGEEFTWPRGIVPYVIDSPFDWTERNLIRAAMDDIEQNTCVRFIEWPAGSSYVTHKDYIKIEKSGSCSSYIGRINIGEQDIQLATGCLKQIGEVQHELLHALGMYHEQSRMDRDDWVHIVTENIYNVPGSDLTTQFKKYESNTYGLPYDYESIMHYGHNYFSRSADLPTIIPRRRYRDQGPVRLGNREKMTDIDAQKISYLYKCLYVSYEGDTKATTIATSGQAGRHQTVRPPPDGVTQTTKPRSPSDTGNPVARLSDDELVRLTKNKFNVNESKNAWRRFKTGMKQSDTG